MKKISLGLAVVVFLFVGFVVWWTQQLKPLSNDTTSQRFVVVRGETSAQIAKKLEDQKLLRSSLVFRIYTRLTGTSTTIQSGEYDLNSAMSVPVLVQSMRGGPTEVWVTLPEGLRREEIAQKFVDGFNLKGEGANTFRQEFLNASAGREGYLFPDTYLFPRDAKAQTVVSTLISTFNSKVPTITPSQLILASILERETLTAEERPIVAGILWKRVNAGWALNTDATIQYARDNTKCLAKPDCKYWEPITRADIENIKSAYNSYKNPGLPPAPIANPGMTSINAAINPTDSSYWYYLHDSSGVIHYAATLEEHNANVVKYLQ